MMDLDLSGIDVPPSIRSDLYRLRDDRTHGATWIAYDAVRVLHHHAAELVEEDARQPDRIHAAAMHLAAVRPSMVAPANAMARLWQAASQHQTAEARVRAVHSAADALLREHELVMEHLWTVCQPWLKPVMYVHSRSGSIEGILLRCASRMANSDGEGIRVIVPQSLPGGEGTALADSVAAAGLRVTLVADAACGIFVRDADVVLVGADSIRADGSITNKVGTLPLALTAADAHIPLLVIAESIKVAPHEFPLILEEMDPSEILPLPHERIEIRNPYFDHTPADLVSAYLTERGVLSRAEVGQLAARASTAWKALWSQ